MSLTVRLSGYCTIRFPVLSLDLGRPKKIILQVNRSKNLQNGGTTCCRKSRGSLSSGKIGHGNVASFERFQTGKVCISDPVINLSVGPDLEEDDRVDSATQARHGWKNQVREVHNNAAEQLFLGGSWGTGSSRLLGRRGTLPCLDPHPGRCQHCQCWQRCCQCQFQHPLPP